jgi:hypothetical protein
VTASTFLSDDTPIMKRMLRIRERMYIETASGIHPSNKELFMSACYQYEQKLDARNQWHSLKPPMDWKDFDNWSDWSDWNKKGKD